MNTSKENFLKSAVLSVEERFGISIKLEKLTEIVGDKMDREWKNFEYNEVSKYMDTSPCEDVADLIAQHYTGGFWPTYSSKVNMADWFNDLVTKIEEDEAWA